MNTRDAYRDPPVDVEREAMLDEIESHRARADRATRLLKSYLVTHLATLVVTALVCGPYRVMTGAVYVASETYRSVVRWAIHRDQGQPVKGTGLTATTGVTAGSYTYASLAVNAQGRVTSTDVAAPRAAFAPILRGYMYYSVSGDGVVSPCDDMIKTGCWRISVDLGNTEWVPAGELAGAYSAAIACQNAKRIPGGKYVCDERHADVIGRAGHKVLCGHSPAVEIVTVESSGRDGAP